MGEMGQVLLLWIAVVILGLVALEIVGNEEHKVPKEKLGDMHIRVPVETQAALVKIYEETMPEHHCRSLNSWMAKVVIPTFLQGRA